MKRDIAPLAPEVARDAVLALQPVTFAYHRARREPCVGFIAEDVPDLVAVPDRRGLSGLELVAALTSLVQQQERALAEQEQQLEHQAAELDRLLQEVAAQEQDLELLEHGSEGR